MLGGVRRTIASLILSVGLLSPGLASAGPKLFDGRLSQDGLGIEVGAIVQGGQTEFASNNLGLAPLSQGLVLRDRNGTSSRMVIGLVLAIASAMAQSGPKSVESKSYVSGDYVVTETTTTYYSEEEKAEMRESTNRAMDGIFSTKFSEMELQLYSRDRFGLGDTSGYKINFMLGAGKSFAFETGFGFGKVDSIVDANGTPARLEYKYAGMPFRVSKVAGPVRIALTYEWNLYKYGIENTERQLSMTESGELFAATTSNPWHLDLSTVVLGRLALTAGATTQELRKPEVGYYLQAGLMF